MYASEWPFLRARKREGASRAPSPGTAPKTSPQRRVCPAWPLELSRCSPKSICDPSCCRSGLWWTVSIIADPGLSHDIPLQRFQQVLLDLYALPIYFLSAELLYAVYTNTTSLDLMHHSFQRSWRHTDLLSSSYSGEGVFEMIPLTILSMGHLLFPSQGCQLEISGLLTRGWSQIQGLRHRGGRGGRVPPILRVRGIIPPFSGKWWAKSAEFSVFGMGFPLKKILASLPPGPRPPIFIGVAEPLLRSVCPCLRHLLHTSTYLILSPKRFLTVFLGVFRILDISMRVWCAWSSASTADLSACS